MNKGKTIAQTITGRTDYAGNPDKTRKGELVTGYQCNPHTVDSEFLLSKQQYHDLTGRDQGKSDILAHHIRQAFKPGEITPELANKLGYELAMRFTKGRHAFIVATHVDKCHIHIKAAASTLIFLQENGLDDLDKLNEKAQAAKDDFNGISTRIQNIDARLKDITALQKHIGVYSKTRDVYAAYRKAGYSKKYLVDHSDDITAHKAAKKNFDALGLEKLPTIKTLKTEYAALAAEKKTLYGEYHPARKHMQDILSARQNVQQM